MWTLQTPERERERSWAGILLGAAPITSLESHSCWPGLAPSLLTQQHSVSLPALSASQSWNYFKGKLEDSTPSNWHPLIIGRHDLHQQPVCQLWEYFSSYCPLIRGVSSLLSSLLYCPGVTTEPLPEWLMKLYIKWLFPVGRLQDKAHTNSQLVILDISSGFHIINHGTPVESLESWRVGTWQTGPQVPGGGWRAGYWFVAPHCSTSFLTRPGQRMSIVPRAEGGRLWHWRSN